MSTIVTRAGKGSPLTNNEVDANFVNLNTDKVQVTGTPTTGQAPIWNGTAWVPGSVGAGTVTSVAATVPSFLSVTGSPITTSGTLALGYSGTALPIANGGTGATTATEALNDLIGYTTTPTFSLATTAATGNGTTATLTFATQASPPFAVGSTIFVSGVTPSGYNTATGALVTACTTTTVSYLNATSAVQTVAGAVSAPTTLTNTSSYYQLFTGTGIGSVVLPVASTLQLGWSYKIINASSSSTFVYSSGNSLVATLFNSQGVTFTCIDTTLTTAAAWRVSFSDFSGVTGTSGGTVVLNNSPTISGTLGFTGSSTSGASFATSQTTGATNIVTAQTTGITTVGGTAQTGALVLGRSTGSQYIDIANGATTSSTTASGTASSISTTVLTVGGTVTGTFVVGMQLTGTNVLPNTYITTLGTGVGGAGTYNISQTQTVASTTITGTTQKTISIGTGGLSGSKTAINIGSSNGTTTNINGVVQVGGSAGTSGQILTSNGASTAPSWQAAPVSLPSQTGNTGKYLTTDGSTASWATVAVSPGGATTNVQYNNAGAFAGSASFTYNSTTGDLSAPVHNSTNGLMVNSTNVASNYTVASGSNAFSVGPITTNSGVTVTVSSGQRWVVI